MLNQANVTIKQSTFNANQASRGGAIYGASSVALNISVHNSTIVGNVANNTFSAGGIHLNYAVGVSLSLFSTILADNTAPTTNDLYVGNLQFLNVSGDYNLVGLQYTSWGLSGTGNQVGAGSPMPSGVSALADNGGFTLPDGSKILTMATQPNGKSWYTGSNASQNFTNDQRGAGFKRDNGGFTDIGAYQHQITIPEAIAKGNNVTSPGGTQFTVTVTFADNSNINAGTIDINDVVVKNAFTGATLNAIGFSPSQPTGNNNPVTATYTFNAPDNTVAGAWDVSDTSIYNVWIVGTVSDDAANDVVAPARIGSFNAFMSGRSVQVSNAGDTDDGDYTTGQLTLREAVNFSNLNVGFVDSISFSLTGTTIGLSNTLGLSDSVNITGPGKSNLSISGGGAVQIFNVIGASTSVAMSSITLTSGSAASGGAMQFTSQTVTLSNMDIVQNNATSGSGGRDCFDHRFAHSDQQLAPE